ncbi:MAG: LPS export ABC transporter periplasmic protein LptC [Pseudomonadota bacterium]
MSEIARRLRSQRRAWAHPGSGHDRVVRIALFGLPAGIGVLAAFLVFSPLYMGGDVSFVLDKNKVDVARERLRIQSALYRGEDAKGQPFELSAGSAVQKSSAEPVVQLNDLSARITLAEGPATLQAQRGRYDMDKDQVAVEGPIQFQTADGYTLETHDATVDLKARKLQSGGRVSGTTPMGTFSGDRLTADLEQRTVALDGNARLRIVPKRANRR